MMETFYTCLAIYASWVLGGAILERYAPRVLDRLGDWITR